jgi:signal transduction histidine kinase
MLEKNQNNIAEFISSDDTGKQIPKFLALLAEQLSKEKDSMYAELDDLVNNIDHIKNVISMQQSYAGSYGVREKVVLSDLIEDALRMNVQGMGEYGVRVVRSYKSIAQLYVDKHKVLQIMINLISNAKHAIIESDKDVKNLTIKISTDGEFAKLEVSDTGIGIAKQDIEHLFEYGFKKRRDGHGFGLHHSAIVANELGGRISVESDGPDKGASFYLWLPYNDTKIRQTSP